MIDDEDFNAFLKKVVELPGGGEMSLAHIEAVVESALLESIEDLELVLCVKRRVAETMFEYQSLPKLELRVSLDFAGDEVVARNVAAAFQLAYKETLTPLVRKLVGEICVLRAQLCVRELQRQRKQ